MEAFSIVGLSAIVLPMVGLSATAIAHAVDLSADPFAHAGVRTAAAVYSECGDKVQAEVLAVHHPPPFETKDEAFAYAGGILIDQLTDRTSAFNVDLKRGDPNADFCLGIGGAVNYHLADKRLLLHAGPSSSDGLADSTRVINVRLEAAGSVFHPGPLVKGSSRPFPNGVLAGWIDDNTEEELVQYLYKILQTHGLSPALGACSSKDSEFVLNINHAGATAGLGTFALYFQLHDRLARERGHRSVENDLRATKKTKYNLGTSKYDLGTSIYATNSSTDPRYRVTHERKLLCPACHDEFAPSDNVMAMFDKPHQHMIRGRSPRWPQIKCKICKLKLSTSPTVARRFTEVISLP